MPGAPIDDYDRFYVEVGGRIRAARISAKITQADLADVVGLTRTSITNLEAGRQRMPLHLFATIERALGVPSGTLLPPLGGSPREHLDKTVDRHLHSSPDTTKEFVQGAIARLEQNIREED